MAQLRDLDQNEPLKETRGTPLREVEHRSRFHPAPPPERRQRGALAYRRARANSRLSARLGMNFGLVWPSVCSYKSLVTRGTLPEGLSASSASCPQTGVLSKVLSSWEVVVGLGIARVCADCGLCWTAFSKHAWFGS